MLLRRIDDADADPLELGDGNGKGVPGLLHASRLGTVGLANALGSGAAGELALQPFLGRACQALLGQPLRLPALETRWCGDPERTRRGGRPLRRDGRARVPPGRRAPHALRRRPGRGRAGRAARPPPAPRRHGSWPRRRSTSPPRRCCGTARSCPGTIVLRVHAVVDGATVTVLPGGLGRVLDPAVPIVTQSSGLAKDVWVVDGRGARPADRSPTHLRAGPLMPQVDLRGSLPTRAAEALFWLGRRAERAEGVARLARAVLARSQHDPGLLDAAPWVAWATAGLRSIRGVVPGERGRRARPACRPRCGPRSSARVAWPSSSSCCGGRPARSASSCRRPRGRCSRGCGSMPARRPTRWTGSSSA